MNRQELKTIINTLPLSVRDHDEPVFAAPWQAQSFAIAVQLHQNGHFEWRQFSTLLADQIAAAGSNDRPENYYHHWLAALEAAVAKFCIAAR